MSTKVTAPGPTQQERALQAEQAALLRQQRDILSQTLREQQLLSPILLGQAGLTPSFNAAGELTSVTEDPTQKEIRTGLQQRQLAALRGELPVDPILQRELGQQETTLRESLRKQLGPGFETSTPGIESLQKFREGRFGLMEASRRGELTLGESLNLTRQQASMDAIMRSLQPQQNLSQLFGGAAQGFGAAQQPFQFSRAQRLQGNLATQQLQQQFFGDLIGSAGLIGAAAFMSSARFKKDIQPMDRQGAEALKKLRETPIYRWRYKNEPESREPHIGPILELAPKEIRADDAHISLGDYMGLMHAGVKHLDRDVRTLRQMMKR